MTLDKNAEKLISLFESYSHAAYAVGGCVRDSIMARPCNDTDIAVSCTPDVTLSILKSADIRCVETGLKHGTVTAVINSVPYEITTFRTDGVYSDNRRPDNVSFVTDLPHDLSRRDFTVNAMAYSPREGVVDLYGGRQDIQDKIIRTVGDPDARFGEDALRILRALRFASTLDFTVEENTARSVLKNCARLKNVARERITAELEKLMIGAGVYRILREFYDVFCLLFDVDSFEPDAVAARPADFALRLAAACDGSSLVLSNAVKHRVATVRDNRNVQIECQKKPLLHMLSRFGFSDACDILAFCGKTEHLDLVKKLADRGECYLISHLDVNGNDLISYGIRGAQIRSALERALFAVIEGVIPNEKQKILDYLGKI